MNKTINYLRTYRKQTHITQSDIAFLLNKENGSNLSRCEKGKRSPSIEMIMLYHLLFDTSIVLLLSKQRDVTKQNLINRVSLLIENLKQQESTESIQSRITYLNAALTRLTQ